MHAYCPQCEAIVFYYRRGYWCEECGHKFRPQVTFCGRGSEVAEAAIARRAAWLAKHSADKGGKT